jgi:hypothetical protein
MLNKKRENSEGSLMNSFRKNVTPALAALACLALLAMAAVSVAAAQAPPAQPPAAQAPQGGGRGAAPAGAPADQPQGGRTLMANAPTKIPAPSLAKPVTPEATPDADGFIPRWFLLEPIPAPSLLQNAVQAEVKKEYFPNQFTVIPHDGDKVTVDGKELTWHAVQSKKFNVNLYHFAREYGRSAENALFWTVTVVNSPKDMPNVRLAAGSNAASVWWLNGEEVLGIYGERQTTIDDGVSKRLTLKKGPNVLRGAVINAGGATDFCVRFLDADDKPLKGYTVSLSAPGK